MRKWKKILVSALCILLSLLVTSGALALSLKLTVKLSPSGTVFSGDSAIKVYWDTVLGAKKTHYCVYDCTSGGYLISAWASGTSFTIPAYTLPYGHTFKITVYALSSAGTIPTGWQQVVYLQTRAKAPTVLTQGVSGITATSATLNLNVSKNNGSSVYCSGFFLGTSQRAMNKCYPTGSVRTTPASRSYTVTGLAPNTLYYYQAYAGNDVATAYGATGAFRTAAAPMGSSAASVARGKSMASIAMGQKGVREERTNFVYKYHHWFYGSNQAAEWCAIFVSWCANQAGVLNTSVPKEAGASSMASWFKTKGRFRAADGSYVPKAGDLFFLTPTQAGKLARHVGIVYSATKSSFVTVEGNWGLPSGGVMVDQVASKTRKYDPTDVAGFGVLVY